MLPSFHLTETIKMPDIPKRLLAVANGILFATGLLFFAAGGVVLYISGFDGIRANNLHAFFLGGALVVSIGSFLSLRARPVIRINLGLLTVVLLLCLLSIEWFLGRPEMINSTIAIARANGVDYDPRFPSEYVRDERKAGNAVTLAFYPHDKVLGKGLPVGEQHVIPLGNPARSNVALCVELGTFITISTDAYGFNNPLSTWSDGQADIVLLGDSYTEGWCVPNGESFASLIHATFPKTVNLGRGGFGPLKELATLREYGIKLRPRIILWFLFENDLEGLAKEWQRERLRKYLNSNYSQNLLNLSNAVNATVKEYVETNYQILVQRTKIPFRGIRHFLNTLKGRIGKAPPLDLDALGLKLQQVLGAAKRDAENVNAKLVVVYLGSFTELEQSEQKAKFNKIHDATTNAVRNVGIELIDTVPQMLRAKENPGDWHQFSTTGHYTKEGHTMIASLVLNSLRVYMQRIEGRRE
jgi:hypothetical protein